MSRPIIVGSPSGETGSDHLAALTTIAPEEMPARGLREALADLGPAKPLPPPPRPMRRSQPVEPTTTPETAGPSLRTDEPPPRPPAAAPEPLPPPTAPVMTAEEIVRTLARVAAAPEQGVMAPAAPGLHTSEPVERPPMIIERAIAEQSGRWALANRPRPSPWPGLVSGFALALVAGGALFAYLAAT